MKNRLLPHQCVLEHGEGCPEVSADPNNTMTMDPSRPGWRVLKGIQAIALVWLLLLLGLASIFSLAKPYSFI